MLLVRLRLLHRHDPSTPLVGQGFCGVQVRSGRTAKMHSRYASGAARRLLGLTAQHTAQHRPFAWTTGCEHSGRPALASIVSRQTSPRQQRGQASRDNDEVPLKPAPKAALLLIGNEILTGAIQDTNTPWLAKLLYRCDAQQLVVPGQHFRLLSLVMSPRLQTHAAYARGFTGETKFDTSCDSRGVDLIRTVTIPDDPTDIAETLHDLKRRVGDDGIIFTSGGVSCLQTYQSAVSLCWRRDGPAVSCYTNR